MKYQNNSGLKQIAIINGKKEIIANGIIFESDRPIIHPGFDKVDDSAEATFKKVIPKVAKNESLDLLQRQINDIQKESSLKVEALSKITSGLDVSEDIKQIISKVESIIKDNEEKFSTVFKRLEILKNAIQTIELEVDNFLYDEDSDATKSR